MRIAVLLMALLASQVSAAETFTEHVKNLWNENRKEDLSRIVQQRLQSNPNDFAALLIEMDYEMAFLTLENLPKTFDRLEAVGNAATTPRLKGVWPDVRAFIKIARPTVSEYTPQQLAKDRKKAALGKTPMPFLYVLQAAEDDGLVKP